MYSTEKLEAYFGNIIIPATIFTIPPYHHFFPEFYLKACLHSLSKFYHSISIISKLCVARPLVYGRNFNRNWCQKRTLCGYKNKHFKMATLQGCKAICRISRPSIKSLISRQVCILILRLFTYLYCFSKERKNWSKDFCMWGILCLDLAS